MPNSPANSTPRRFSGIANLYGDESYKLFNRSHVIVIGVGGVGSWVAEALARSGMGQLTLIDMDHIAESNINRQIQALDSTIGAAKVAALKKRLLDINPDCHVITVDKFVEVEEPLKHLDETANFIVDCVDDSHVKAALIAYCKRSKLRIITVGGAGGKTDPTKIGVSDLSRTTKDTLLSRTRKMLRQQYSFSRNLKRYFGIPAVYSTEQPVEAAGKDQNVNSSAGLNCAGFGSATHMTASFAFVAVGYVLSKLSEPS